METKQIISWLRDKADRADNPSWTRMMHKAAKRLEELEQKQTWISGKKPPKEWKDKKGDAINFLAVIPGVGIDIANWIEPTKCWFCMGVPCKVTYWMPLPEPPEEVKQ